MTLQHTRVTLADGKSHRIRFDFAAFAEYEDAMGKPISALGSGEIGFRELRALAWAGLLHENPNLTLKQAGKLLEINQMESLTVACVRALQLAIGKEGEPEGEAESHPTPTRS